jgi:glycerol-3-phosphate O-acyltransferase
MAEPRSGLPIKPGEAGEPDAGGVDGCAAAVRSPTEVHASLSAMMPRLGGLAGRFARRFFSGFTLEPEDVERLRTLERRGAVVFVMRYSSRLDYLLFNWLFLRSGIRLAAHANGVRLIYLRPFREVLTLGFEALKLRLREGREGVRRHGLGRARQVIQEGGTVFLFLRTDRIRARIQPKTQAVASASREIDQLREIVDAAFALPAEVSLVPLALFWRTGNKPQRPLIDVLYGAPDRPTTTWKIVSFLWSYRNLAVRVGRAIDLRRFIDERRDAGPERVLRQVRRSILIFLRREEKPVLGATLRSRVRIEEAVLGDPQVQAAIQAEVERTHSAPLLVEMQTRRQLREIAAHPSPTVMALLYSIVDWMFGRLFARIEVRGLDRVVEAAKLHPLVLIPSHRSHFDYLILSWLFYGRHLAPPLVAAGANLAFFPLGPTFRRAGAFFLRRSFEGDQLYTSMFRSYIQLLIKDGATQEFFIEGARSRTGKTLQPRLGLLSMILDAFRRGVRRDVYVVPIGFTYERLVEESSMTEQKRGARKKPESPLQLLRAGSVLRHRFGAVTVRFGEPMALSEVGELGGKPEDEDPGSGRGSELHDVSRRLGEEICRRINLLITAGRSSVSAAALLASPARGARVKHFEEAVVEVAEIVQRVGLEWSDMLAQTLAAQRPLGAIDLLVQAGMVEQRSSRDGDLLVFDEDAREVLAYYRATILPALAWPGLLALPLLDRTKPWQVETLMREASRWLNLLRGEFFPPRFEEQLRIFRIVLEHFVARGWMEESGTTLEVSEAGRGWLAFFAEQVRPTLDSYRALFTAVEAQTGPIQRVELMRVARAILEERLALGEARHSEALCDTTFSNAFQLLLDEEIVVVDGSPRRDQTLVAPGPQAVRLAEWTRQVAQVLACG